MLDLVLPVEQVKESFGIISSYTVNKNTRNGNAAGLKGVMTLKKYDAAISFAGKDRKQARSLAIALSKAGLNVFFDESASEELWGKNLYEHLTTIYRESALTIIIVSSSYCQNPWTHTELKSLRNSALHNPDHTILPIRVDDSEYPSELSSIDYIDLNNTSYDEIARLVIQKLDSVKYQQKGRSEPELTTYHVIPRFNDWAVKRSGASRATAVCKSKDEAINKAKELVEGLANVEIVVHKSDGTIEKRMPERTRKEKVS